MTSKENKVKQITFIKVLSGFNRGTIIVPSKLFPDFMKMMNKFTDTKVRVTIKKVE